MSTIINTRQMIKDSATFNIADITKVLAELVSQKTGENYAPIVYNNNYWKSLKHIAAVAPGYMAEDFLAYSKYTSVDYGAFASNMLRSNTFLEVYKSSKKEDDIDDKDIIFERLLSKFNVEADGRVNNNEFKGYNYINEFLDYLFVLQLSAGGKRLTYRELMNAVFDFLDKEDQKATQKSIGTYTEQKKQD